MNPEPKRWLLLPTVAVAILLSVLLLFIVTAPRTEAQSQNNSQEEKPEIFEAPGPEPSGYETPGSLSPAQRKAISAQGYLVSDQAAYEQAKEKAAAEAQQQSSGEKSSSSAAALAPQNVKGFSGVYSTCCGPSDSTGAIGPSRYIELVNIKFAIKSRTGKTIKTGSLNSLLGVPSGHDVFDPQIIWDPGTERFYYAADDVVSATDNRLAFGFSKTSNPSSAADFCKYVITFGSRFPDYPKLGDTQDLILIGANAFNGNSFLGSDLYSITKPTSGSTCPAANTFTVDTTHRNLKDSTGTEKAFTPVPANQTDTSGTGWVVARPKTVPNTRLLIYQVTKNTDGTLNVGTAKDQAVPAYNVPANAAQKGTDKMLDTLDARNTQAVSAIDPSLGTSGVEAVWTQHTVFGGHGAEVRWYKINPDDGTPTHNPALLDSNVVTDPSTYYFNGAISPDRKVNGSTQAFGSNMVLGFNGFSETQFPDIRMVSKIGTALQSPPVVVKNSKYALKDFTCDQVGAFIVCRWGDYAAATPDPGASDTATTGQVWLASQFVRTKKGSGSKWGSFIWAATP